MCEEIVIQNPLKGKFYPFYDQAFVGQARLFDTAMVSINGTVKEGTITLISTKGINLKLEHGDQFYKWCHVMALKKSEKKEG